MKSLGGVRVYLWLQLPSLLSYCCQKATGPMF
jgi:hypothetical protein